MCMAIDYANQLMEIYDNVKKDMVELQKQLYECERLEQDYLHIIEGNNFNAAQGYKLAKLIQENRQKRRNIKNELKTMQMLKRAMVDKNINILKSIYGNIKREEQILKQLQEDAVYTPRVLETTDIKAITSI